MARLNAAREILNRGWGRSSKQPIEATTLPLDMPEFPTDDEMIAELRRRGLLGVIALIAEDMKLDRSDDGHETQARLRRRDA